MKTGICRILQFLLLALYAIGAFIVILGAFGIAIDLISYFTSAATPDYKVNLAQVGLGSILTYAAKNAERILVAALNPQNDKFIALLERPITSFFQRQKNEK